MGNLAISQSCTSMFFPTETGTKYQHSSYKAEGTLESITDATILSVNRTNNKVIVQTALRGQIIGNVESYNTTIDTECYGDITYTDPSQLIDPAMLDQFINEYNGQIYKKEIEIPSNIKVGDSLSDYFLEIYGTVKGIEIHFSSQTYARSVIGKEQVEALTGTYNCFVIESTTHIIIDIGGFGGTAETKTGKLWVAKDVGTVRSEEFQDGVLHHYTELTGFRP